MSKRSEQVTSGTETRKEWMTPRVVRMAAGNAESSANPLSSDGQISFGS
jgi:hypothetical protein